MRKVYLDNAATTPIDSDVFDAMLPFFKEHFGNPSSAHAFGRKCKNAIEISRRTIAAYLNCHPSEIVFTSGGTEADNIAIRSSVNCLDVKNIITSKIEHKAVLQTSKYLEECGLVRMHYVNIEKDGKMDLIHLESLLKENENCLVSLMHANNEIGTLLPLNKVAGMCKEYGAYFHSDTVQTMGHYSFNLEETPIDFITCAAHKLHGPKGVGFLYRRKTLNITPLIYGGAQERNMRGGTENIYGIVGLAKAIEIANEDMDAHQKHVQTLKNYMIQKLKSEIPNVSFNGDISDNSLYTVLNVQFPPTDLASLILFSLDLEGIACSGGSACSSGSNQGSHVLAELGQQHDGPSIRFSFSKFNTMEEIDYCVDCLKRLLKVNENAGEVFSK